MFLRSRRRMRVFPPLAAPPDRRRSDISVVSPLPARSQISPAHWTGEYLLLANANTTLRTAPRAGIGAGALAAHGHAAAVAQTAIAPDIHQALDIQRNLAP